MRAVKYDIWAVVKDIGGVNAVLPIVKKLEALGNSVLLIANGVAPGLLGDGHDFVVVDDVEYLLNGYAPPHAAVVSMCEGGGIGRDLVPLLKGKSTIFAVQDFWGAHLRSSWADTQYRPDYLLVNDEYGRVIATDAWPDFNQQRVLVAGFAAFDKYASMDVDVERRNVRSALGLSNLPIVLFTGQWSGTSGVLDSVVDTLNELQHDCYLLPRAHLRMKDFPDEFVPWQRALSKFRGRTVVDWFGQCNTSSLIAACAKRRGVVVSMFSTTLIEAATLKAPAISVMFPEYEEKYYRPECAFDLPVVALGCAKKAESQQSLHELLESALTRQLDLELQQERHFKTDGKNAERCAQQILSHM